MSQEEQLSRVSFAQAVLYVQCLQTCYAEGVRTGNGQKQSIVALPSGNGAL